MATDTNARPESVLQVHVPYDGTIDSAVAIAINQHRLWMAEAMPSSPAKDRVTVYDGDRRDGVVRRPFKSGGHWRVRFAGTARIVSPHYRDGNLCFQADWSRP
jgi:hypothetical protein